MIVSLRLNKEDEQLIKKYAEIKGMSLSDLFRNALIEKIQMRQSRYLLFWLIKE